MIKGQWRPCFQKLRRHGCAPVADPVGLPLALDAGDVEAVPAASAQTPAVPIKKSVFPDHIVRLEDGKKLKMLNRHLQTSYGLSPDAYRAKWGLPRDYPMVAPNYAATRSGLAKKIGLGRKPSSEPVLSKLPARRARGAKA